MQFVMCLLKGVIIACNCFLLPLGKLNLGELFIKFNNHLQLKQLSTLVLFSVKHVSFVGNVLQLEITIK